MALCFKEKPGCNITRFTECKTHLDMAFVYLSPLPAGFCSNWTLGRLCQPRSWQTPEQGCLGKNLCGRKLGLGWGEDLGDPKAGQLVGMDTEVWQGDPGGGYFPTPNTPCPGQCLMRGPLEHVMGSGAALVQGWVTGVGHDTTIRRWKQGQAMKEEFRNMT